MEGDRVRKGGTNNYILAGIVVVLVIALIYVFTQSSGSTTYSSTTSVVSGQQTTTPVNSQTSTIASVLTTISNTSFSPIGTLFCTSGLDLSGATNSSYYANIYNSTVYNLSDSVYWSPTMNYPIPVYGSSCVENSGSIYCIGGTVSQTLNGTVDTDAVYTATLSTNGTSNWLKTLSYPDNVSSLSCVTSNGYVYCTGGTTSREAISLSSYYSALGPLSVGHWTPTTPYPQNLTDHSCVANNGYIYCIGGTAGFNATNSTYYAQLTSSGIGKWVKTSSYPVHVVTPRCVADSGYVYCIGNNPNFEIANTSYYASLSSSGIGKWTRTTNYPINASEPSACILNNNVIYCAGAASALGGPSNYGYYSRINASGGIGQWLFYSPYSTPIVSEACTAT